MSHPALSHLLQQPLPSFPAGREGAFAGAPESVPGNSAERALTCLQLTYVSFLGYASNLLALQPQGRCKKKCVCPCMFMCAHYCSCGKSSISYLYIAELQVPGEAVFLLLTIISDIILFYDTASEEMLRKTCAELSK